MRSQRSSKKQHVKLFGLVLVLVITISLNAYTGSSQINDNSIAGFSVVQAEMGPDCLNCHPEKNNTMFASSGHSILDGEAGIVRDSDCLKCHNTDGGIKGNYLKYINSTDPTDDVYSKDNFSICFNCHSEENLLAVPQPDDFMLVILNQSLGIPLYDKPLATNFYGDSWWKKDGNSNLHFFHLVELRAMGGAPSTGAYCAKCHNPHGTSKPRFIVENITFSHLYQNGSIINNSDHWNQNYGSTVTGFNDSEYQFCEPCHNSDNKYMRDMVEWRACGLCHDATTSTLNTGSHSTHFDSTGMGPGISSCDTCHGTNAADGNHTGHYDGTRNFADGENLVQTSVCDGCHSSGGTYNGVDNSTYGAKANWKDGVYNGSNGLKLQSGKDEWCVSCHDDVPSVVNGETAPNKVGDNSTYGYYITGHGRISNYTRMSWQDTLSNGNSGANQSCEGCHNSTSNHIVTGTNPDSRLKQGYENDQNNTNCNNCHYPGGSATANPQFYTNSGEYEVSAHGGKNCTDCHEVHGTAGAYKAMTKGDKQSLCYQCHTEGVVMNDAISNNRPGGYVSADDIQEAFGKSRKHPLGTSFTVSSKTYSLECTSCHNVHLITGKYWDAEDGNKSPITRLTSNTEVWGDEAGEKMDDYASLGSGTGGWYYSTARGGTIAFDQPAKYQPPKNGSGYDFEFSGDVMPDYTTFCTDCHSIGWGGNAHGLGSANKPSYISDSGTAGFWGSSGNPDAIFNMNYVTRGRHNGHLMRWPYDSAERSAGINFVLSCTDCHEAHGSNRGGMIRERFNVNANGDCGTGGDSDPNGENCNDGGLWNGFCNACHYYYGGQHAGMSCGYASCHETNSIHTMKKAGPGGGTQLMLTAAGYESNYTKPDFTPEIDIVEGHIGSNELLVTFKPSQYGAGVGGVFTNDDLTGSLEPNDFWLLDTGGNNPKTITNVSHTEGGYTATLTMNTPLVAADLNNDILATRGKSIWAWYEGGYTNWATGDLLEQVVSAGPWPVKISSSFAITEVEGMTGYDRLHVEFTEAVYANTDETGSLQPSDFTLTDIDNTRTIVGVDHAAGGSAAVLVLNAPLDDTADIGTDILEAASNSIYNKDGFSMGLDAVAITTMPSPVISSVEGVIGGDKLKVTFSDPMYADANMTGALAPADFMLSDTNGDNPRTIAAVQHTPGAMRAIINMSSPLIGADIGTDTLAAAGGSIFDRGGYPIGTETVNITAQTPPAISKVEAVVGHNKTLVSFTEGVYSNKNQSGALEISDFTLTDNDNSRTITSVEHVAGQPNAILTLSTSLDGTDDIGVDTLATATGSSIFNNIDSHIGTGTVNITGANWPVWGTSFQFNEPASNLTITDETGLLTGTVNNSNVTLPGDGYFHGDENQGTYIDLTNNASLKEPKTLTIETRVFTSLVDLDTDDINRTSTQQRIFERKRSFQLTIFRGDWMTNWTGPELPRDQANLILKYRVPSEYRRYCDGSAPDDAYIGNGAWWKQVGVNRTLYPIVPNHWYKIKVVFDSDRPTIPVNIWADDLGIDGLDTGENWAGYKNVGKPDPWDGGKCRWQAQPGDEMLTENQLSYIGSPPNHNSLVLFKGWIDWVSWKPVADYSGVDDPPV